MPFFKPQHDFMMKAFSPCCHQPAHSSKYSTVFLGLLTHISLCWRPAGVQQHASIKFSTWHHFLSHVSGHFISMQGIYYSSGHMVAHLLFISSPQPLSNIPSPPASFPIPSFSHFPSLSHYLLSSFPLSYLCIAGK